MKRLITYLYEYNEGKKRKNTGFVRMDVRDNVINMEVSINNNVCVDEKGALYVIVNKENYMGIYLGDVTLKNKDHGQKFSFDINSITDDMCTIKDMVGIAIRFVDSRCMASSWGDSCTDEIGKNTYTVFQKEDSDIKAANVDEDFITEGNASTQQKITYKKIGVSEIKNLPSSNWHLATNQFLLHGANNYGFLFIKEEQDDGDSKLWLGVPGYFEKAEMIMAIWFGFLEFEPIPKEIVDMEMDIESKLYEYEKNQEPKTGVFGAWFVLLEK